jgi:hypothetical protein
VDEQPPEGEEVVEALARLKQRVKLGVQHLREVKIKRQRVST